MISHFRVENYKLLSKVDIPLTPIHVIVGENDSGKTSLLEAISAFCRSAEPGRQVSQIFDSKWQGKELVFLGSSEPCIEFDAHLEGRWDSGDRSIGYGFRLRFPHPTEPQCQVVREWFDDGKRKDIPQINHNFTFVSFRSNMTEQQVKGLPLDEISILIGSCGFYRLDPKIMSLPASLDTSRKFRMDPDGFGLPTLLDDILGYDTKRFDGLSEEFCRYFPEFRRVHIETEMGSQRHYEPSGLHTSGKGYGKAIYFDSTAGTIRAQQASDGALLFLGFLSLLYVPRPPKVLLIEEPEKGVYPKRLAQIVGLLKRMIEDPGGREIPQIIITTHSPYVLSHFQPEEVTLMSREGDHAIARPVRDAPRIRERLADGDFYLGELWYNLDEEELFPDVQAVRRD
jgi:AAA domain, putative AbiEii toxin, Type IV TA system/AAA ATPase domain